MSENAKENIGDGPEGVGHAPIYVSSPSLPDLNDFIPMLEDIWERRYLTNFGTYHQEFERKLGEFFGAPYVSLVSNATLGLLLGLRALDLKGEVITTPFSFVATAHAIKCSGLEPVFCDIDEATLNIDVHEIEAKITNKTCAIMPVHVFGNPCDLKGLQRLSEKYNLPLIYDAAHAFGVEVDGKSLCVNGDISVVSFHATKAFNTIEGGVVISRTPELKRKVDLLRNFGFTDEISVQDVGINAKMNELQAAFGLLQLKLWDTVRNNRRQVYEWYLELLDGQEGINVIKDQSGHGNYSYMPILLPVDKRDKVYAALKAKKIYARRYFYPLIPQYDCYKNIYAGVFPNADRITNMVLCMPLYEGLNLNNVYSVCSIVVEQINKA